MRDLSCPNAYKWDPPYPTTDIRYPPCPTTYMRPSLPTTYKWDPPVKLPTSGTLLSTTYEWDPPCQIVISRTLPVNYIQLGPPYPIT